MIKYPTKKQLEGTRVYFGSLFEGTGIVSMEAEVWGNHSHCTHNQDAERDEWQCTTNFSFSFSLDGSSHIIKYLPETFSQTCPELTFLVLNLVSLKISHNW